MTAKLAVAALVALGGTGHADGHSYHAAIGIADGVGAALLTTSALVPEGPGTDPLIGLGIVTCVLAGPVVHALHANFGRAGVSLAAHLVIPAIGVGVGAKSGTTLDSTIENAFIGAVIGHLVASAIDLGLAYRDTDPTAARIVSFGGSF